MAAKKKAKRKTSLKTKTKGAGRKVGKAAKATVGAVAGAASGAAEGAKAGWKAGKKRGRKKNPEKRVVVSSSVGRLLLDYHKISENVEHVAASAIRGQRVELSIVKKARRDLNHAAKIQPRREEKSMLLELVRSLDYVIHKPTTRERRVATNPAQAFSLETEVKRSRQRKAKKAIGRSTGSRRAAGEVKAKSARARVAAATNPVITGELTDETMEDLVRKYGRARTRHASLISSPSSTEGEIAHAKKRLDESESKMVIYAEVINLDPKELKRYMAHAKKKQKAANGSKTMRGSKTMSPNPAGIALAYEIPSLGTLERHPKAVRMWEHVYTSARTRGYSKTRSAKQAWGAIDNAGYRQDAHGDWHAPRGRRKPNPELPKPNPLKKVPKGAKKAKVREIVGRNIATEMEAGAPQKQAVAIALSQARRDAPGAAEAVYGPAPNPPPEEKEKRRRRKVKGEEAKRRRRKKGAKKGARQSNPKLLATGTLPKSAMPMFKAVFQSAYEYYRTERKADKKKAEEIAARTAWDEVERYYYKRGDKWRKRKTPKPQVDRPHDVKLPTKPKRKRTQKVEKRASNPKRRTSDSQHLIKRCQKLWEEYCKRPSKKRLMTIFDHLEKMKASASKKVKAERSCCLRAANVEAKRLKMKR